MAFLFYIALLSIFSLCFGSGISAGSGSGTAAPIEEVETESTKRLVIGYPLTLTCKIPPIDESPVQVLWFKDNDVLPKESDRYTIFPENATLYVPKAIEEDVGFYRCETQDRPAVVAFNISVITITYKKMPKSTTVLEADKLSLVCDVDGSPHPMISWEKDGVDIKESINASRYELNENEHGIPNASLLIASASYEDRGKYACNIATEGISITTSSFVRVKDMYAALWPFLGICAEVVILCIIIFIYEKRRMKIEFEESDNEHQETKAGSQNKDVRQRK